VQIAGFVAVITLWLVSAAVGVLDLLVARALVMEMAYALNITPWAHGAIDKFAFFIFGIVWLILVYVIEHVYRKAADASPRKLIRTFARVTVVQLGFAGLSALVILFLR
jgi:hypothetical protein